MAETQLCCRMTPTDEQLLQDVEGVLELCCEIPGKLLQAPALLSTYSTDCAPVAQSPAMHAAQQSAAPGASDQPPGGKAEHCAASRDDREAAEHAATTVAGAAEGAAAAVSTNDKHDAQCISRKTHVWTQMCAFAVKQAANAADMCAQNPSLRWLGSSPHPNERDRMKLCPISCHRLLI